MGLLRDVWLVSLYYVSEQRPVLFFTVSRAMFVVLWLPYIVARCVRCLFVDLFQI